MRVGALKGTEMKRRRAGSGDRGRDVGEKGLDDCGGLGGWGTSPREVGAALRREGSGVAEGQAVGEGGF